MSGMLMHWLMCPALLLFLLSGLYMLMWENYVNENYDEGATIFQAKCEVLPTDNAEDVAAKIHELEMEYFPKVVEKLLGTEALEVPIKKVNL